MKAFSGGLLLVAAVVYLVTVRVESAQGAGAAVWVAYVRAAAEAGMVGGLADWFAVTALFRHPLGVPVPHTAIIPTRKDALGAGLGEFVGTHFLAEDVVRGRLRAARLGERVGGWLARQENAERVSGELAAALRGAVGVLRDDDVQAVLEQAVVRRLAATPLAPVLGELLGGVVADGSHHPLVDLSLENTHRWLVENHDQVVEAVARQAPVWSPRFVDERVAERVYAEVVRVVGEVRDDPDHELRHTVDRFLAGYARALREDPDTQRRVQDVARSLLEHPKVRAAMSTAGASVRRLVMEAIDDPDSELRTRVRAAIADLGARLRDDVVLREKVDRWVEDAAAYLVTQYRGELVTVITDTVQRWDGRETARRIELQVGRDLQFIRINGTVVGALVGVLIEAVTRLVT